MSSGHRTERRSTPDQRANVPPTGAVLASEVRGEPRRLHLLLQVGDAGGEGRRRALGAVVLRSQRLQLRIQHTDGLVEVGDGAMQRRRVRVRVCEKQDGTNTNASHHHANDNTTATTESNTKNRQQQQR